MSSKPEFCGRCGVKLDTSLETNTCPECGAYIESQNPSSQVNSALEEHSKKSSIRKISIILGIIVGGYSFILITSLIEYNVRLSSVRETAFGLGNLVVARVAPSIELGNLVGILFFIETIILFLKPKLGKLVALLVLAIFNILLSLWIINQIPQILYQLYVILSIGILLNIFVIIYSGVGYRKVKAT